MQTIKKMVSSSSPNLLVGREYFKPFDYKDFYERWKTHERAHWLPSEVSMQDDVFDWKTKLTNGEKKFLVNIFRFFTQGDVDVAGAYCTEYLPFFSKTPEIAMFLCSVAAREAIHVDAYAYLIETLGMPESTYKEFLMYNEMKNKQTYLKKYATTKYTRLNDKLNETLLFVLLVFLATLTLGFIWTIFFAIPCALFVSLFVYAHRQKTVKEHIACNIALFSGFTEGMQLFSSFTMLLAFPLNGLMKGMGQIVTWSMVDETQHTEGMIELFKIFVNENSTQNCQCAMFCSCIRPSVVEKRVLKMAREMVALEDAFIDLAFKEYGNENGDDDNSFLGVKKSNLKLFIRFICNKRLSSMGYNFLYGIKNNPLPEFEIYMNAPIQTNFFENRSTDYARQGIFNWDKVWKRFTTNI